MLLMSCELLPLLHQSYWATKRPISTLCFQTSIGCLYGPSVCLCFVHFSFSYFRNPLGIRLKVDWISIFYCFKKIEKKKKLHCYHSQGVKLNFNLYTYLLGSEPSTYLSTILQANSFLFHLAVDRWCLNFCHFY